MFNRVRLRAPLTLVVLVMIVAAAAQAQTKPSAPTPRWSEGQPSPEIQRQRVAEIMQRCHRKIEFWEVVNEPSHVLEPKIDGPYRWAREANPADCLIVNDYHVLADGGPGFFRLLTNAKQQGVPFDGIGIQAHEPRTMRFPRRCRFHRRSRSASFSRTGSSCSCCATPRCRWSPFRRSCAPVRSSSRRPRSISPRSPGA